MKRVVASWIAAVAFVPASGALLASTSAAEAASVSRFGWWTRNPAASAPDTGFEVTSAPDGPVSVAAIEIAASTGLSHAVLTLHESDGLGQDGAKLQVCQTPNEWKAGAAQAWAEAPKAECAGGSAELTRNAAATTWAADVTSLVGDVGDEGVVSLMIVPVPAEAGAVPAPFEVDVDKIDVQAEASAVSSSSAYPTGAYSGSDSGGTTSADSASSSSESPPSSGKEMSDLSGVGSSPSFDPPLSSSPVAPTTADGAAGGPTEVAPASDATPAPDTSGPAELAAVPTQATAGTATPRGNATVQAVFFVAVAALAGTAAGGGRWFARRRSVDPTSFA